MKSVIKQTWHDIEESMYENLLKNINIGVKKAWNSLANHDTIEIKYVIIDGLEEKINEISKI